jgi:hypothetical protein
MPIKIITAEQVQLLSAFMERIREDPRIGPAHISLYVSLIGYWSEKNSESPLYIFSQDIMPLCKISGLATYHRSIKDLDLFGYIRYVPSYNHFLGSLVYFIPVPSMTAINTKKIFMKYFLLPDKQNYRIIKVQPEDVDVFKKKYQRQIMLEADSVAELLVLFSAKVEEMQES